MPIVSTDILFKGSTTSGTAGNTTANGGPETNLGKYASSGTLTDATLDNVFNDITGDQNAAGQVDYQCIFVHNNHASLTLQNSVVWITSQVAGGADVAIGLDTTAASAVGASAAQALTIANATTAPAGVTFSAPTTKAAGLSIGNLVAGNVKGIWIRRTANNSAALNNDGATIRVEGDTAA